MKAYSTYPTIAKHNNRTLKQSLHIALSWLLLTGCSVHHNYIDPTGTYELDSKAIERDGDIYGYFGKIQIKSLSKDQIIMTFMINKGAPSYNSGSFVDTLDYKGNQAVYTDPEVDPSCKISFGFNDKGVTVNEETNDFNFGCGFGHAVVAKGFYKKLSSDEPELRDPMTDEQLEIK